MIREEMLVWFFLPSRLIYVSLKRYIFIVKRKQDHWIHPPETEDNLSSKAQIGKYTKHPVDIQWDAKQIPNCFYHWNVLRILTSVSSNWSCTNLTHSPKPFHHVILGGSNLVLIHHIPFHQSLKLNVLQFKHHLYQQSHLAKDTFSHPPVLNEKIF